MKPGRKNGVVIHLLPLNEPGMTTPVRDYCRTSNCLKETFRKYFSLSDDDTSELNSQWCCYNCTSGQ
jgi:hypothetical protein